MNLIRQHLNVFRLLLLTLGFYLLGLMHGCAIRPGPVRESPTAAELIPNEEPHLPSVPVTHPDAFNDVPATPTTHRERVEQALKHNKQTQ